MNIFLYMIETNFSNEAVIPIIHPIPEIEKNNHEQNTSEGSKFADGAIRIADHLLEGFN